MQCSEEHIPKQGSQPHSLDRGNIDFTVRESSIIQEEKSRGYIGGHVNILCVDKNSRQVLRHRAGVAVAGGDDS